MASDKVEAEAEAELMWPKLHCFFLINTELLSPLRIINCLCWLHSPQQRQKSTSHYFSISWLGTRMATGSSCDSLCCSSGCISWLQLPSCQAILLSRCKDCHQRARLLTPHTAHPGEKSQFSPLLSHFPGTGPGSLSLSLFDEMMDVFWPSRSR